MADGDRPWIKQDEGSRQGGPRGSHEGIRRSKLWHGATWAKLWRKWVRDKLYVIWKRHEVLCKGPDVGLKRLRRPEQGKRGQKRRRWHAEAAESVTTGVLSKNKLQSALPSLYFKGVDFQHWDLLKFDKKLTCQNIRLHLKSGYFLKSNPSVSLNFVIK